MNYKTNVMRILDANKVTYQKYDYSNTDAINGLEVATILNQDPNKVFKTIVTISNTNNYYVFMLPVNKELDFKMSIKEFNERCISNGQATAEFDLRPVDMAIKDGVSWNIETKDNEVYFYKVG